MRQRQSVGGLGKLLQPVSWQEPALPGEGASQQQLIRDRQPREMTRVTNSLQPGSVAPRHSSCAASKPVPSSTFHAALELGRDRPSREKAPSPQSQAHQDVPGATHQLTHPASNKGRQRARLALPSAPRERFPARETSTSARSSPSKHPGPEQPGCQPARTTASRARFSHTASGTPAPLRAGPGTMLGRSICISLWGAGSPFASDHSGLLLAVQLHNTGVFGLFRAPLISRTMQARAWAAAEPASSWAVPRGDQAAVTPPPL